MSIFPLTSSLQPARFMGIGRWSAGVLSSALLLYGATTALAAPANDTFGKAQALVGKGPFSVPGTTVGATGEEVDPVQSPKPRTVWYLWKAPTAGLVKVSAVAQGAPLMCHIVFGPAADTQVLASANFSFAPLRFYAVAGKTYRFCVDDYVPGYINDPGRQFTLSLAYQSAIAANTSFVDLLLNDDFADALSFTEPRKNFVLHTRGATFEAQEVNLLRRPRPQPAINPTKDGGMWVAWKAAGDGPVTVTARTPNGRPAVVVAGTGSSIGSLALVSSGYNVANFSAKKGTLYRLDFVNQQDHQVLVQFSGPGSADGGSATPVSAGNYTGLAGTTTYVTLNLTKTGAFTARVVHNGATYGFPGKLDAKGNATGNLPGSSLTYSLTSSPGPTSATADDTIVATIGGTVVVAQHAAYRIGQVVPERGSFTALFAPDTSKPELPQGIGFARFTISDTGAVTMTGRLAQGTAVSASGVLSGSPSRVPQFFVFVSGLHGGRGVVAGQVGFRKGNPNAFQGKLNWAKPAEPRSSYYPEAFTAELTVSGVRYTPPGPGALPLRYAAGTNNNSRLTLTNGTLPGIITTTATLTASGVITFPPSQLRFSARANLQTGAFTGTFIHSISRQPVAFTGTLLQDPAQPRAGGYFLGPVIGGKGFSGTASLTAP
jgi:hypothetical protein